MVCELCVLRVHSRNMLVIHGRQPAIASNERACNWKSQRKSWNTGYDICLMSVFTWVMSVMNRNLFTQVHPSGQVFEWAVTVRCCKPLQLYWQAQLFWCRVIKLPTSQLGVYAISLHQNKPGAPYLTVTPAVVWLKYCCSIPPNCSFCRQFRLSSNFVKLKQIFFFFLNMAQLANQRWLFIDCVDPTPLNIALSIFLHEAQDWNTGHVWDVWLDDLALHAGLDGTCVHEVQNALLEAWAQTKWNAPNSYCWGWRD